MSKAKEEILILTLNKVVRQICSQKFNCSLETIVDKKNIPAFLKRRIKMNFLDCTLLNYILIASILNISIKNLAELIENELGEDFRLNDK